ncbi:hypothetical protein Acy02nite_02140 [Actinoplanes cyaneus]|uniref:Uncharacterized protein n=1 Tax=Actinoplanes cyaneus TaxID=52696 RepID=A0A919M2N9_9ACTN|nr:hypothetical protein Acy02nite_02140 [Actinoplanes cyaneus]
MTFRMSEPPFVTRRLVAGWCSRWFRGTNSHHEHQLATATRAAGPATGDVAKSRSGAGLRLVVRVVVRDGRPR